jgi:hypothetical protein
MANPTTNYGFVLPTPTDLVTDLPADFDVALQGVDTRLKALQPGTTLGDIAYSSATANTNTRLGIGSTGNVLTVAAGVPSWAAPAPGSGMTLLDTLTLSGSSVTSTTFSSSYNQLMVYVKGTYNSVQESLRLRMNANTGSVYNWFYLEGVGTYTFDRELNSSSVRIGTISAQSTLSKNSYSVTTITRPSDSDIVFVDTLEIWNSGAAGNAGVAGGRTTATFNNSSAPITSITLFPNSGTFQAGTAYIYGVK